jgi:hypothetical protein
VAYLNCESNSCGGGSGVFKSKLEIIIKSKCVAYLHCESDGCGGGSGVFKIKLKKNKMRAIKANGCGGGGGVFKIGLPVRRPFRVQV